MRKHLILLLIGIATTVGAQTARKLTVNLTDDGQANIAGYLPQHPTGKAIVGCPGGGYSHLALQNEGHDWAAYFNSQGIAYFVLTYRMPNGNREIPMSDAKKALRTVRDSATVWNINPYDVGIMGFSAGGHLASTVSTHSEWAERPNFSILFYPVISMNERETHKGSCVNFLGKEGQKDAKLVKEFSNSNAVRSHITPPAIILTANDDRAVPPITNAVAYYSAMRRRGNDCALYIYPSGGHGFGFRSTFKYHDQMLADLSKWIQEHPGPRKDAIRVACIGNSITDGMGIQMSSQLGYPARLQQLLGSGYHVKNFGVSSRTLLKKGNYPYWNEQAWRDAQAFKPDIVIIKLGTNDSKPENWQYSSEFESDLNQMITELRPDVPLLDKKGRKTKKLTTPSSPAIYLCTPIPAVKPTWNISDSIIVSDITPIIKEVAQQRKASVIDLHTLFNATEETMASDGIHPNEKGAKSMAEIIAAVLRSDNK